MDHPFVGRETMVISDSLSPHPSVIDPIVMFALASIESIHSNFSQTYAEAASWPASNFEVAVLGVESLLAKKH